MHDIDLRVPELEKLASEPRFDPKLWAQMIYYMKVRKVRGVDVMRVLGVTRNALYWRVHSATPPPEVLALVEEMKKETP